MDKPQPSLPPWINYSSALNVKISYFLEEEAVEVTRMNRNLQEDIFTKFEYPKKMNVSEIQISNFYLNINNQNSKVGMPKTLHILSLTPFDFSFFFCLISPSDSFWLGFYTKRYFCRSFLLPDNLINIISTLGSSQNHGYRGIRCLISMYGAKVRRISQEAPIPIINVPSEDIRTGRRWEVL